MAALGALAAAVKRLYADRDADRVRFETLAERSIRAMEASTAALNVNTEGLKAIRDETLALYRQLVRAGRQGGSGSGRAG